MAGLFCSPLNLGALHSDWFRQHTAGGWGGGGGSCYSSNHDFISIFINRTALLYTFIFYKIIEIFFCCCHNVGEDRVNRVTGSAPDISWTFAGLSLASFRSSSRLSFCRAGDSEDERCRRGDLHQHKHSSGYTCIISMCSLGIKPTTFVLPTQCSTTEPQEHTFKCMATFKNV